jgi:hypothetical protein
MGIPSVRKRIGIRSDPTLATRSTRRAHDRKDAGWQREVRSIGVESPLSRRAAVRDFPVRLPGLHRSHTLETHRSPDGRRAHEAFRQGEAVRPWTLRPKSGFAYNAAMADAESIIEGLAIPPVYSKTTARLASRDSLFLSLGPRCASIFSLKNEPEELGKRPAGGTSFLKL